MPAYSQRYKTGSTVFFNLYTQEIHPQTRNRAATVQAAFWCSQSDEWIYAVKWSHTGRIIRYQGWQLGNVPFNLNYQGVK